MINGLQGIPGSGKSYEASVFQVLEALKQGRKVITNLPLVVQAYAAIDPSYAPLIELRYAPAPVRGVWNAEAVDPATGQGQAFRLFDDMHIEPPAENARTFGTVWCYWSDWKHPKTNHGPLFVVDECHVAMPKIGTDKSVIEWYKLHRHFNIDVLLATQNFRQMSQDIAELMAMVIKVRKADVLGRADEYIRKVHAGYRGAEIQQSIRKYEPHFFTLYRSHTQGSAVLESGATDIAPLSVKIKRWTRAVWGVAACAVAFAVWVNTGDKKPKTSKPPAPLEFATTSKAAEPFFPCIPGAVLTAAGECIAAADGSAAQRPSVPPIDAASKPVVSVDAVPEPYAGKSFHLTGRMLMAGKEIATFVVAVGGARFADVTSVELVKVGYRWEPVTDCMGYLRWAGTAKAVVCDAPRNAVGSSDKPVVLYSEGAGAPGVKAQSTGLAPSLTSM